MSTMTIAWPGDFYLNLGRALGALTHTTRCFHQALFMPPCREGKEKPLQSPKLIRAYRAEILEKAAGRPFIPLLAMEIVPGTKRKIVQRISNAHDLSHRVLAGYVSPSLEADNTLGGLTAFEESLSAMERSGMVLCLRCEPPNILYPERETLFLEAVQDIADSHPDLRILLQGVRTVETIGKVVALGAIRGNVAATITAPDIFAAMNSDTLPWAPYRFRPDRETEEKNFDAVRRAVVLREPWFVFGSQSAAHSWNASAYLPHNPDVFSTAEVVLSIVARLFVEYGGDNPEEGMSNFVSGFGPDFLRLDRSGGELVLEEGELLVPDALGGLTPLAAGHTFSWKVSSI